MFVPSLLVIELLRGIQPAVMYHLARDLGTNLQRFSSMHEIIKKK